MSTPYRPRRYVDGLVAIPWELARDPSLRSIDKAVALALAGHAFGRPELRVGNHVIGRSVGLSRRAVLESLVALREAGWIAVGPAPGPAAVRPVILLWLVPDDWEGLVPTLPKGVPTPARRPRPAPPAGGNGNGHGHAGSLFEDGGDS